jgi:hypothetical protein
MRTTVPREIWPTLDPSRAQAGGGSLDSNVSRSAYHQPILGGCNRLHKARSLNSNRCYNANRQGDKYLIRTRRHGVKTREPLALVIGSCGHEDAKDPRELKLDTSTTSTESTDASQALCSMGVKYQRTRRKEELTHQLQLQVLGLQRHYTHSSSDQSKEIN